MCQCSPCGWVGNLSPEVQECFHELCTRRCENRDGCAWRAIASRQTDRQTDRKTDRQTERKTGSQKTNMHQEQGCGRLWAAQAGFAKLDGAQSEAIAEPQLHLKKALVLGWKAVRISIGGDTFDNWDCCNSILRANSADLRLWGPLQNVCGFRASAKRRSSQLHGRLPVCSLLLQEM